jgi:hypothetical protein
MIRGHSVLTRVILLFVKVDNKELKNSRVQEAEAIARQTTRCLQRRGKRYYQTGQSPADRRFPTS